MKGQWETERKCTKGDIGMTEERTSGNLQAEKEEETQRRMWMRTRQEEEERADAEVRNQRFYEQMAETWSKDAVLSELLEENRARLRNIREERNRMLEESDRKWF